MQKYDLKIT